MKTKVGIIGATGYTGVVLTRLLINHPDIEISYLSSEQHSNKNYFEVHPMFYDTFKEKCKPIDVGLIAQSCDVVFFATPNGFSKDFLPKLLDKNNNIKVIDLSADLRLEETLSFNKKHKLNVVYGLPELHREEIKSAQIVSNPGCYPTSILLALAPVLKNNIIDPDSIIIDSKSGVSGAGRQIKQELHFCEVNESFSPYNLAGKHRHIPEIENELFKILNKKINVLFSPHLLPINRGILSTIYANLTPDCNSLKQDEIHKIYSEFYKDEYFVKVLKEDVYPNIKNVRYTNFCHLLPLIDIRTKRLIVASAIDNMVKGASGQAIQNMNIVLSFNENLGLDSLGQIP